MGILLKGMIMYLNLNGYDIFFNNNLSSMQKRIIKGVKQQAKSIKNFSFMDFFHIKFRLFKVLNELNKGENMHIHESLKTNELNNMIDKANKIINRTNKILKGGSMSKRINITISIDSDLNKKLAKEAKEEKRSKSALLEISFEEHLKNKKAGK
jgi:hypothetical protein